MRHERGKRLWFNVTDIMAEDIVGAELRLFQKGTSSNKKQSVYTIVAYQLINTDNGLVLFFTIKNLLNIS